MESRDLRVGNWLKYNNRLVIVDEILIEGINLTHEGAEYEYEDLKPVELTEEILLKCGFTENKFSHIYEDDTRVSIYVNDGFFFCQIDDVIINNIKHLHQLQNLYYALCNEELNVQL